MKISEMIEILETIKDKYGDIDCGCAADGKVKRKLKYIQFIEKLIGQIDEVQK